MKKVLAQLAVVACAFMGASAHADRNSFMAPGAYLLTNVTYSDYGDNIDSAGGGMRLGFGFGNGLSVEGGADYLGKVDGIRVVDYSLAAVYTHALTPGFALRGSVGAAHVRARGFGQTVTDSAPLLGVGGEVLVGRNVFLMGEYRRFARDVKIDNFSMGLKLRF